MTMNQYNIGFALCGSFCTFSKVIPMIEELKEKGYTLYPIMSDAAYFTDTRFGTAQSFREKIETICSIYVMHIDFFSDAKVTHFLKNKKLSIFALRF